jgi:hypothetical protein
MDVVKPRYQEYYEMLSNLWETGWGADHPGRQARGWLAKVDGFLMIRLDDNSLGAGNLAVRVSRSLRAFSVPKDTHAAGI